MSDIGGIYGSYGIGGSYSTMSTGPMMVSGALAELKKHPTGTVEITDTVENIRKNLDALQAVAAKFTALSSNDADKGMTVTGTQF